MNGTWLLTSLLALPVAALGAAAVRDRIEVPAALAIAANALLPGSGLVLLERPLLEVVLCILTGEAAMVVAGGVVGSPGSLVPFMVVGGVWAALHTPLSPLRVRTASASATAAPPPAGTRTPSQPAASGPPAARPAPETAAAEDVGYSVAVRCTECGAEISVPVLRRMAHCEFCDSDHLVTGHDSTLWLTLPAHAHDDDSLRNALLDHYRYLEYLRLYRRSVAPLERQAVDSGPSGGLISRPEVDAAAAIAEAAAARQADAYRERLAARFTVSDSFQFLSPYRHGVGTLYQASFGRRPGDQEKALSFTIGTVEAVAEAGQGMDLPPMGKLSYIKALRPAAESPSEILSLPLDEDETPLLTAFGDLDHKRLDRQLNAIRLGSRFEREVTAVVWRPWWIVRADGPGIAEQLLVDGASGSVVGPAPYLNHAALTELPEAARAVGASLRFVPMECPTCGDEFPFDGDAVVHFCANCHRTFEVAGERKPERAYLWDGAAPTGGDAHLVPFWCFPFRLRTADGQLLTDLEHLRDGIDGTFDQIGDAPQRPDRTLLVPAIRCLTSRLTASAFNRLFHWSAAHAPPLEPRRIPLDEAPRPLTVCLDHDDARRIAPLYLANAFGRRDLARANVHQVASWLFEAELEARGELAFVAVPAVVTEPFRAYVGRPRVAALT